MNKKAESEKIQKLELSDIKSRLIVESGRAQDVTQKYINEIHKQIARVKKRLAKLLKKEVNLRNEIKELENEAIKAKESADSMHEKTINLVVSSFGVEPPWSASFENVDGSPRNILLENMLKTNE